MHNYSRAVARSLFYFFLSSSAALSQNTIYTVSTAAGQPRPTGDGGLAQRALLNRPGGLFADTAGNLYISDQADFRIRKIDSQGKITTVVGTGVFGYSGDGGQATAALIGTPKGIAMDTAGNLYFADSSWNVVRMITPAGIISTVAGNGVAGFTGNNGPATSASLGSLNGIAVDSSGTLYIAEASNNRIRK